MYPISILYSIMLRHYFSSIIIQYITATIINIYMLNISSSISIDGESDTADAASVTTTKL